MSTAFAINENNGFLIVGRNAVLLTGIDAVVVNCQHEAQTLAGEDPFRNQKGLPNFTTIWAGTPDVLQFEFFLRRALLAVNNVDSVSNFQAEIIDNELSYSIDINTPFGSTAITG